MRHIAVVRALFCGRMALPMIGLVVYGCAGDPEVVRERFVPTPHDPSCGGGATWTALVPFPDKNGAPHALVHAGIGDTFPVQEQDGRTLFKVLVVDGNDDHLVLEVSEKDVPQRIDVKRDERVPMQVGGGRYEFIYPTTHVSSAGTTTTSKAFLLVKRCP